MLERAHSGMRPEQRLIGSVDGAGSDNAELLLLCSSQKAWGPTGRMELSMSLTRVMVRATRRPCSVGAPGAAGLGSLYCLGEQVRRDSRLEIVR